LWFSHESNQFFVTSYVDGKIYGYEVNGNLRNEFTVNKIFTASGQMYPRSVIFVEALNKVVVGYESGLIAFYDIGLPNFPVCPLKRLPATAQRDHYQSDFRAGKGHADYLFQGQDAQVLAVQTAPTAGSCTQPTCHQQSRQRRVR
jgi:hypothetical protein